MDEKELSVLIENELYKYILALSEDELDKVTIERIQEGLLWFLLKYEEKIQKEQRNFVIRKIWKMFENKNLIISSKEKYLNQIDKIGDMEI